VTTNYTVEFKSVVPLLASDLLVMQLIQIPPSATSRRLSTEATGNSQTSNNYYSSSLDTQAASGANIVLKPHTMSSTLAETVSAASLSLPHRTSDTMISQTSTKQFPRVPETSLHGATWSANKFTSNLRVTESSVESSN
jgi:hypothetical protein